MIGFDLTDEQRLLEQSVREWAAREVAPAHPRARPRAPVRQRPHPRRHGAARPARRLRAAGVRRRRAGLRLPRPGQRRARVRRHVAARHHVGARRPQLPVAAHLGHRGAEAAVPRAAGAGQEDCGLRPHRARRGQRRARHSDDRREEGRPVRAHRARRPGSRWRTSPITSWSLPGPTPPGNSSATRPASARSSSSGSSRGSRAGR